jgi:hypothetical protein
MQVRAVKMIGEEGAADAALTELPPPHERIED